MSASIPAIHALHFLTLLERWQIDGRALVAEVGLTPEALAQPGARISLPLIQQVIARANELSGESALGFYLGLQMRVSTHGYLGFALLTAATAGMALRLAVRFAPTHTDALKLTLREGPEKTSLVIEELVDLGSAREVVLSALMIGIWQMGNVLTGERLVGQAALTIQEPADFPRFKHLLNSPVQFNQPENLLTFENSLLNLPFLMADPAAQQLAREQCERELDELAATRTLVDRVRRLLALEDGGFRTIHEVARALHMSDRTLKRKLMVEGTSYVELLDTARKERALLLLRSPTMTLEQVAEQVGYSELSNFTRAFRRWTGVTPRKFRLP